MTKKRSPGEGGIWFNKTLGRWVASPTAAQIANGCPPSKTWSSANKTAAIVKRSHWEPPPPPAKVCEMTVAEWVEQWIEVYLPRDQNRGSTNSRDITLLRVHVVPSVLGKSRMDAVTGEMVEDWLDGLVNTVTREPLADSSRNKIFTILHKVLRTAAKRGHILADPMADLRAPRPNQPRKKILSEQQIRTILDDMETTTRQGYAPIVRFLAMTGCRCGEAAALTWDSVDFDRLTIRIDSTLSRAGEAGPTKTRAGSRTLPLTPGVGKVLRSRWEARQGPYVFSREDGSPQPPDRVLQAFQKSAQKAGISTESCDVHALRHASIRRMLEITKDPRLVADHHGDRDLRTVLEVYHSISNERAYDGAAAVADQFA